MLGEYTLVSNVEQESEYSFYGNILVIFNIMLGCFPGIIIEEEDHIGSGDEIAQRKTTTITLTSSRALLSKPNQYTRQGMR